MHNTAGVCRGGVVSVQNKSEKGGKKSLEGERSEETSSVPLLLLLLLMQLSCSLIHRC